MMITMGFGQVATVPPSPINVAWANLPVSVADVEYPVIALPVQVKGVTYG